MSDYNDELETGVVINTRGETALVELFVQDACESCGARILCIPDGSGKRKLHVANPVKAKIGNVVAISEKSQFLLKLSVIQYGLPLLGFITGIFSVHYSGLNFTAVPPEVTAFLGGILGLFFASVLSRRWAQRLADAGHSFFSIQKIIS